MKLWTDEQLTDMAQRLGEALLQRGLRLATAESCTGGWIAKTFTDVAGSSAWFEGGLVTYSNPAKRALLGVPEQVLTNHGAVSEATVLAMAAGALTVTGADVSVSVSGIAGPGGAVEGKPVGTVWFGFARRGETGPDSRAELRHFDGDRDAVRRQSVAFALDSLLASTRG